MVEQENEGSSEKEVPDHLKGKIFFDLIKEPVLTPDGITYDSQALGMHIEKNGSYDPITR